MRKLKRFGILLTALALCLTLLPAQFSLAADSPAGTYNFTDLNLADGANVPSALPGQFGVILGAAGSSVYKEDAAGDYARMTAASGCADLDPALGRPTLIKNNTIQNFPGPLVLFDYGGGTVPTDHLMNKNIYFEENTCTNLGGPFISLVGTWGIWDPVLQCSRRTVGYCFGKDCHRRQNI